MKKRTLSISLAMVLSLSFVGCGSTVPAINENELGNKTEEVAEIIEEGASLNEFNDRVQEIKDGDITSTDKSAEVTASPEPTAKPSPTPTPEPTATPEPTPTPHTHNYTETVTRQASCTEAGEKTLTCSCGDVKTEAIPVVDHNWEAVYQTVTHPGTGHVEVSEVQVQVQVGTTDSYTIYECAVCGYQDTSPLSDHRASYVGVDRIHATARTIAYDYPGGEPIYETQTQTQSQWVVDTPETTTQELVGYTCSICGATQ